MNALTRLIIHLITTLLALAAAATTAVFGANLLGLFRGTQTLSTPEFQMTQFSIIDEGFIVFAVSLSGAILASSIAAGGAGIGKSAILGILSGITVAIGALCLSKAGLSEGPPIVIGILIIAVAVGFGLKYMLNKPVKTPVSG